jgi:serine/threonine protein kinase/tetratricopeptide (TPR) repeat protein
LGKAGQTADVGASAERFEIREKIGEGGMGAVYRVRDHTRNADVALKTLLHTDAKALYRFKREFRSLADVTHPNLVNLYELHTIEDEWFFTMELINGCSFIEWVRPYIPPDVPDEVVVEDDVTVSRTASVADLGDTDTTEAPVVRADPNRRSRIRDATLDRERLEDALFQLADGVYALHCAGKLHRDLKPSNVLVDREGRVVLLDFGLASDITKLDQEATHAAAAVGTPMYMSPEQAADAALTEASDWYSVGVMLYEALTGRRPFENQGPKIFLLKQTDDPPAPSTLVAGVPPALDSLCMALLSRDPLERPSGSEILTALGRAPSRASIQLGTQHGPSAFVGRERQLSTLREGLAATRDQMSCTAFVRGESGMGKSALVRHFLAETEQAGAVLLEGRCYQRESVPYKALDAVIDATSRYLANLPEAEVTPLLPREIVALAKLFPVLKRVPAINEPAQLTQLPPDVQELRRRAFGALRHLLKRIAETTPVVIYIDDLQWGDVDSARFLADVMHHPDPPAVLMLLCYRIEDEATSPLLQTLREQQPSAGRGQVHELTVSAFTRQEVGELLRQTDACPDRADQLWEESRGNPFFLSELMQFGGGAGGGDAVTLDDLLALRTAQLDDEAKAMLRACAVAGRPMSPALVAHAAGLPGEGAALQRLRTQRMVRVKSMGDGADSIEPYHDRIRETVVSRLQPKALVQVHRGIAVALEGSDAPNAEALVEHWLGAQEPAKAGPYAADAAQDASDTLAFHRAADFYAIALEHMELDDDERRDLLTHYAHALTNAGRLDDAADAYARAAIGADSDTAIELGRLEFEQLLRRGRLEEGIAKTREVINRVGLDLPHSHRGALASIVWQRLLIKLRGLGFRERSPDDVPKRVTQQLSVCWSATSGLGYVEPFFGKAVQMRFMRTALAAGDPAQAALALSIELGYLGMSGKKTRPQAEKLRSMALEIAERTNEPRIVGFCLSAAGLSSFLNGYWAEAAERIAEGERMLLDHAHGARWELDLSQIVRTSALLYLGRFGELTRMVPVYLREAKERGDVYAARGLRGWRTNAIWLALDRPDEARAQVEAVATEGRFHLHHYYEMLSRAQIDIYRGDGEDAWQRVERSWPHMKRSMLLRIQSVRIEGQHLRARCALAALGQGDDAAKLAVATTAARSIAREKLHWGAPLAQLISAALACHRGDDDDAVARLRAAIEGFEAADMAMYAATARHRLGHLIGGDEGAGLVAAAEAWCESESVLRPSAMVGMYAPAFPLAE